MPKKPARKEGRKKGRMDGNATAKYVTILRKKDRLEMNGLKRKTKWEIRILRSKVKKGFFPGH